MYQTFTPRGPVYLVGTTAIQCPVTIGEATPSSFRIRCAASGYLVWGPSTQITATAPIDNVPSPNTMGMTIGGVETLTLPFNSFFKSSVAGGFEIIPGDGL